VTIKIHKTSQLAFQQLIVPGPKGLLKTKRGAKKKEFKFLFFLPIN
jgi:hypothetical protein